jgi:hypothetical protein
VRYLLLVLPHRNGRRRDRTRGHLPAALPPRMIELKPDPRFSLMSCCGQRRQPLWAPIPLHDEVVGLRQVRAVNHGVTGDE